MRKGERVEKRRERRRSRVTGGTEYEKETNKTKEESKKNRCEIRSRNLIYTQLSFSFGKCQNPKQQL